MNEEDKGRRKRITWRVGIASFLILVGFLWYGTFHMTGIFCWNYGMNFSEQISPPRIPKIISPRVKAWEVDEWLEETARVKEELSKAAHDPQLREIECRCGCRYTLASCRCVVAIEQMKELGIME